MYNSKIIMINGKKRSGKNHIADLLKADLESSGKKVKLVAFADPIKNIIAVSLGITVQELDEMKNNDKHIILEQKIGIKKQCTMRDLIQRFGTDAMQNEFGSKVWYKLTQQKVQEELKNGADVVIITDFRFAHEYFTGSLAVKVYDDNLISDDAHSSENSLDEFQFDVMINNTAHPDHDVNIEVIKQNIGL